MSISCSCDYLIGRNEADSERLRVEQPVQRAPRNGESEHENDCVACFRAVVSFPDAMPPLIVVMVGLPARGKTYISRKLTRYLNWIGIRTRVFNVGEYRRKATSSYSSHDFFRADNSAALAIRNQAALDALHDVAAWIEAEEGQIAVFDATNTTRQRRALIMSFCTSRQYRYMFVESHCTDQGIIQENILEVKVSGPDYFGLDQNYAVRDFLERIKHYEDQYEPLSNADESDLPYIRIINQGQQFVVNHIEGSLQSKIVYYLMNTRVSKRTIYICQHGETEANVVGRIGGDSPLTENGERFAVELARFIEAEGIERPRVWTSHYERTVATARHVRRAVRESWRALNELDAGVCDGLTYSEIKQTYPEEYAKRSRDKFRYRYPMGESYQDLVVRLEPVIMELERQSSVIVICHQAVTRCLLAYFLDKPSERLPYLHVPLHTVFKLTPVAYGCEVDEVRFNIPAVDTQYMPELDVCESPKPSLRSEAVFCSSKAQTIVSSWPPSDSAAHVDGVKSKPTGLDGDANVYSSGHQHTNGQ